jgi:hypothetical protein
MSRVIIFNNKNSWSDMGLVMSGATPLTYPTAKISALEIELSDGYVDTSRIDGNLHYGPREITYAFAQRVSAYDETYGMALSSSRMNQKCQAEIRKIHAWLHQKTDTKLYDTAYCTPSEHTGYYFVNAMVSSFRASKAIGQLEWIISYEVTFKFDPYMYEYDANPTKFVMFSGPTEDAVGMGQCAVRIFNKGTNQRMIWVNDNNSWLMTSAATESDGTYTCDLTFKPAARDIYSGPIGFYLNHYMNWEYNGVDYKYHITSVNPIAGGVTFIDSEKIVTEREMGYTDQNGCKFQLAIHQSDGSAPIADLLAQTGNKFMFSFIWGTANVFDTPLDQPYIVLGKVKGEQTFLQVTGHDASTIEYVVRNFGDTFELDDDPYNELLMSTTNYGFYELDNPDVLRRSL